MLMPATTLLRKQNALALRYGTSLTIVKADFFHLQ